MPAEILFIFFIALEKIEPPSASLDAVLDTQCLGDQPGAYPAVLGIITAIVEIGIILVVKTHGDCYRSAVEFHDVKPQDIYFSHGSSQ